MARKDFRIVRQMLVATLHVDAPDMVALLDTVLWCQGSSMLLRKYHCVGLQNLQGSLLYLTQMYHREQVDWKLIDTSWMLGSFH